MIPKKQMLALLLKKETTLNKSEKSLTFGIRHGAHQELKSKAWIKQIDTIEMDGILNIR